MLLIDGARYELWIPDKEVEDFHPIVKEHIKDIFGENSLFIEANKLTSDAGKGSIPDGFVIVFGDKPEWHILEMELSSHDVYKHVVDQVGRFISGIGNTNTQRRVVEAIYQEVTQSKLRKAEFEEKIGSGETYKFLNDLISKHPVLTVIIEEKTVELAEAIGLLKYSPIKIIEFQTLRRVGAESVHAHLFEPLYNREVLKSENKEIITSHESKPETEKGTGRATIVLREGYFTNKYLIVKKYDGYLFPEKNNSITLVTDIGETEVIVTDTKNNKMLYKGLSEWYQYHSELKVGDKVRITIIEPQKKYRLEIVK